MGMKKEDPRRKRQTAERFKQIRVRSSMTWISVFLSSPLSHPLVSTLRCKNMLLFRRTLFYFVPLPKRGSWCYDAAEITYNDADESEIARRCSEYEISFCKGEHDLVERIYRRDIYSHRFVYCSFRHTRLLQPLLPSTLCAFTSLLAICKKPPYPTRDMVIGKVISSISIASDGAVVSIS